MKIKRNSKEIPIFFASDKNYVPFLTVSIKSLIEKSNDKDIYKIYILTDDLTYDDIKYIKSLEKPNITVEIVDVKEKINIVKSKVALRDYYTPSIYFRLFIPAMFPQYNKAIYLDADICVNTDIAKLYKIDLGFNYIGAVQDESVMATPDFIHYVRNALDVPEKQYFNSGVVVMNLKKFRDGKVEDMFYKWVFDYSFGSVAPDQDFLNCVCKNRVKYFEMGWNKQPMSEIPDNKLYIIHYNHFMKPWKYDDTIFQNYFWKVAKNTPYYDKMKAMQKAYTDEQKANDQLGMVNLCKMAVNIANSESNYKHLVLKKSKEEDCVNIFDLQATLQQDDSVEFAKIKGSHRK